MDGNEGENAYLTDINITPFVDVLLVLLIIFMITAPAMTRSVGVKLPKTRLANGNGQNKDSTVKSIIIGLDVKNRIIFQGSKYNVSRFFTEYPMLVKKKKIEKVFIQADKTTSYDNLLQLMVFLKNQGHENIGLVFDQKE